jgi:hypothetical protein
MAIGDASLPSKDGRGNDDPAEYLRVNPLRIGISTRALFDLEPIQEVAIQGQRAGLVKRRSMMRIMARRTKAAADRA